MSTGIEPLTAERYRQSVADDGGVIGRSCREHPSRTVPTCPEWTGADLLAHLTAFTLWLRAVVDGTGEVGSELPVVDPAAAVRDWDRTLDDLVDLLRVDPQRDVPNWSTGEQTAAFWLRRTAQDVAIHRWDAARLVADVPEPVPADVARDGIGEYLDVFVTTALAAGAPPAAATLELDLADSGDTVRRDLPDPGPVTTLRGTASDVLLGLWHRRDPLDLVAAGDPALIESWPHI